MEKTIKYLIDNGYNNLYADPQKFEDFIQSLTVDKTIKIVEDLNKLLRNKENEEVITEGMIAGEITAPTKDIRNKIIEEFLNTFKSLDDNKKRAELTYYTFINLHMFSDGNGRTSRLLYGLITGEIESKEWYIHGDDDLSEYEGNFCRYKGMKKVSEINQESRKKLSEISQRYKEKYKNLDNKFIFWVYYDTGYGEAIPLDKIIPPETLERLTEEEQLKINTILGDTEGSYSIAGITMLIMADKKNQLDEWIRRNEERTNNLLNRDNVHSKRMEWIRERLSFDLEENADLLKEWNTEDWKSVITIGNELKSIQFSELNKIHKINKAKK